MIKFRKIVFRSYMNEDHIRVVDKFHYAYTDEDKLILDREDGPAIEFAGGSYNYMRNNKNHRLDGPAVHWNLSRYHNPNMKTDFYYIDGVEYRKEEYEKKIA